MQEIYVSELVATLKRQAWFIVLVSIGVAVIVGAWGFAALPRVWTADTTILYEQNPMSAAGVTKLMTEFGIGNSAPDQGYFKTILTSRELEGRVVDRLGLMEAFNAESRFQAIQMVRAMTIVNEPAPGVLMVRATWPGRSRLQARGGDPGAAKAAELANECISVLGEITGELDFASASQQRKFLEEQISRTQQELLAAEDKLVKYATTEGMINPSSQTSGGLQAMQALMQRETDLRVELEAARKVEAEALSRLGSQERMIIADISEQRDPQIDQLNKHILDLQRQIAEQTEIEGKSEQHPDVKRLRVELDQAQSQLAGLLGDQMSVSGRHLAVDPSYQTLVSQALQNRLSRTGLEAKLSEVTSERDAAMGRLQELPAKTARYDELQRNVQVKSAALDQLSEQYEAVRIAEAGQVVRFNVLDPAIPPEKPSGQSLRKIVALAFFVALLLSTGLAFWRQGRINAAEAAAEEPPPAPPTA